MTARLPALLHGLPEDIPVPAGWLHAQGISSNLIQKYLATGYLQLWSGQAYFRPGAGVHALGVLYSLQALGHRVWLGGLSALEQQGYAHQLPALERYGVYQQQRLPTWAVAATLTFEHSHLFNEEGDNTRAVSPSFDVAPFSLRQGVGLPAVAALLGMVSIRPRSSGFVFPIYGSSPERAILELLDDAPQRSFEQLDTVFESLVNLRPQRVVQLLEGCRSIKVKRLFLYLAQRHAHTWWPVVQQHSFDLGKGKRQIYAGGQLDATYQITVPLEREHVF
jgi:hypothetical protein